VLWGRVVAAEVAEVLGLQSQSQSQSEGNRNTFSLGNRNTRSNLLPHAAVC
jgi:hypothetical protein